MWNYHICFRTDAYKHWSGCAMECLCLRSHVSGVILSFLVLEAQTIPRICCTPSVGWLFFSGLITGRVNYRGSVRTRVSNSRGSGRVTPFRDIPNTSLNDPTRPGSTRDIWKPPTPASLGRTLPVKSPVGIFGPPAKRQHLV